MLKTHRSKVAYVEYFRPRGHVAAVFPPPPNPLGLGFGGVWD